MPCGWMNIRIMVSLWKRGWILYQAPHFLASAPEPALGRKWMHRKTHNQVLLRRIMWSPTSYYCLHRLSDVMLVEWLVYVSYVVGDIGLWLCVYCVTIWWFFSFSFSFFIGNQNYIFEPMVWLVYNINWKKHQSDFSQALGSLFDDVCRLYRYTVFTQLCFQTCAVCRIEINEPSSLF
jgi:hypothetical protein